jgi:hypothetical protein
MTDTTNPQLDARQRIDAVAANETPIRVRIRRFHAGIANGWSELLKSRTATLGAVMIAALMVLVIFAQSIANARPKSAPNTSWAPISSDAISLAASSSVGSARS